MMGYRGSAHLRECGDDYRARAETYNNNTLAADRSDAYKANESWIERLDNTTYWVFMAGIWKDHRDGIDLYYFYTMGFLFLGLMLEKQAINWLTNRWGCTYNKL